MSDDTKYIDDYIAIKREQIDNIDREILELLTLRARQVLEIANLKKQAHKDIYSPEREQKLIQSLCDGNSGVLSNKSIENIFSTITKECRLLQKSLLEVHEE